MAVVGESTTGVYIDDTAVQSKISPSGYSFFGNPYPVTFDINRVELARGPQGTLFGAGAEGGTVRFIYNQPDLHDYSGEARAEFANTKNGANSYESGLALGGPIVDGVLGFRASAYYRTDGGYINRIDQFTGEIVQPNSNSTDTKAFRLALKAAITDAVSVTPSFYYQQQQNHDISIYTDYLSNVSAGHINNGQLLQQPSTDTFYLPALNVEADLGPAAKLTSITSYFSRNAYTLVDTTRLFGYFSGGYGNPLGSVYPVSYADASPEPNSTGQELFNQEIRVGSTDPSARLTWVGGLFYTRRQQLETSNSYSAYIAKEFGIPATESLLFLGTKSIDTQAAVFGQVDYEIVDHLKATLGLRVASTKSDYIQAAGGIYTTGAAPFTREGAKETPVTPKIGLSYQYDEENLYYISIAKGYRVGGGNSPLPTVCGATAPNTYDSDSVWSYEIGAKNRLFNDRVHLESSVFHLKWSNIQEDIYLPCGFGFLANTKNATSNGFDLSVQALVTDAFQTIFSVAYADARLDSNYNYDGYVVTQKGDSVGQVPQVPSPWNLTLSGRYDVPLTAQVKGYIWAEDIYRTKNPGPFANQIPGSLGYIPALRPNPATNMMNLRVGAVQGKMETSLFINNVINSLPKLNKYVDYSASPVIDYSTFRPRTVGVNVDYHF
jgi:outer membrane receptor protein involved in Fe transport